MGTLGIADGDTVELSNLHRQILFTSEQSGLKKSTVAKKRLHELNPHINIVAHDENIRCDNALKVISPYDIVVDGTDNFTARYLINDACRTLKKPNVYASIQQFEGQCTVFSMNGPCYRCLYGEPPQSYVPNCAQSGVIGALTGLLGTIQAVEVIKLILRQGNTEKTAPAGPVSFTISVIQS